MVFWGEMDKRSVTWAADHTVSGMAGLVQGLIEKAVKLRI